MGLCQVTVLFYVVRVGLNYLFIFEYSLKCAVSVLVFSVSYFNSAFSSQTSNSDKIGVDENDYNFLIPYSVEIDLSVN